MNKGYFFSLLLSALLFGCSSTGNTPDKDTIVTGSVSDQASRIYWLDTIKDAPSRLTEKTTLGREGHYDADYRWRAGVLREVILQGSVRDGDKMLPMSVHIRYDTNERAVYQKYRLNGSVLPLRKAELVKYAREANFSLESAKAASKAGIRFFQGYWSDGELTECDTDKTKTLKFMPSFPRFVKQRLEMEDNFIAAVGSVGNTSNLVSGIIALDTDSADCIERPEPEAD
ncbi:DUF1481 domain-containing protein [Veronia pacifica]|uniref:Peptidylprolyl isomerase n=1 Tax=Veronia pacifica TaxID=1080227 RepID=A0A1C3ECR0_9GAMM|nr:DUF1481 domain-containing protein [Veronia pacifica]ODA31005.1 hypothetical protein A8L45_18395 [Veronia pacifica]